MEILYNITDESTGEGEILIKVNVPAERVKNIALDTIGRVIIVTNKPSPVRTWFTIPSQVVRNAEHFGLFIAALAFEQNC